MTKIRIEAADPSALLQDVIQNTETAMNSKALDVDAQVMDLMEEIFGSITNTENVPEHIDKKIKNWFMRDIYPDVQAHVQTPPNPNGWVGSDALGTYDLPENVYDTVSVAIEDFIYMLAEKYG